MLRTLMNNSVVWAFLSICTVIGIPSFIYSIKSKNKMQISFAKSNYNLISTGKRMSQKIKILYDNIEVKKISVSQFAIWNSGNLPIEKSKFVSTKPLTLLCKNTNRILSASIISETDSDNKIVIDDIEENGEDCKIIFSMEYMNPNDGIVVQVIHEGNYDDFSVDCKLIGGKKVREVYSQSSYKSSKKYMKKERIHRNMVITTFLIFFIVIVLLLMLVLIKAGIFPAEKTIASPDVNSSNNKDLPFLIAALVMYFFSFCTLFFTIIPQLYKIGIPKQLKKYCKIE